MYEKIDKFIQRMHDLDIILKSECNKAIINKEDGTKISVSDNLAIAIILYEISKKRSSEDKYRSAMQCLGAIDQAYTSGYVTEGQGVFKKLVLVSQLSLRGLR
jgi:hypothetical protein